MKGQFCVFWVGLDLLPGIRDYCPLVVTIIMMDVVLVRVTNYPILARIVSALKFCLKLGQLVILPFDDIQTHSTQT